MKRILILALFGACTLLAESSAFEVAAITPCKPGTPEPPGEHMGLVQFVYPGGRFNAQAASLKYLIEWSYDLQPSQHSDGPAWMASERFDIVAKAAANASDADMKHMVQALLAERFHLKVRHEQKEVNAYVISIGKSAPRLSAPADGEARAMRMAPIPGLEGKTGYRISATRYSLNTLADAMARQLGRVIINKSGLDGDYDFTLDLTPEGERGNQLDPASMLDALRQQLGLSVKAEKTTVNYLEIESAERVTAGNQ